MVQELSLDSVIAKLLQKPYLACTEIHDHSCLISAISRFLTNVRTNAKLFIPLFFVPTLIMKRKELKTKAGPILKGTLQSCLRTIGFVSLWWAVWRLIICKSKDIRGVIDGWNAFYAGLLGGLAMYLETDTKAGLISLLMLPRLLETAYNYLVKRGILAGEKPFAGVLLYGAVMGILNFFYQNNEAAINPSYLKAFKKIWGLN